MMDYSSFVDTANQLIKDAGKAALIRRPIEGTGEEWDPGSQDTTPHAVTIVETQITLGDIDGSLVQANDSMIIVSVEGLTIEPTDDDLIEFDGHIREIVWIKPVRPGPTTILYKALVR